MADGAFGTAGARAVSRAALACTDGKGCVTTRSRQRTDCLVLVKDRNTAFAQPLVARVTEFILYFTINHFIWVHIDKCFLNLNKYSNIICKLVQKQQDSQQQVLLQPHNNRQDISLYAERYAMKHLVPFL